MICRFRFFLLPSLIVAVVAGLQGCAGSGVAPVISRSTSVAPEPEGQRPGLYIVKRGDTLRRIAELHGREVAELVRWNNLSNPNVIEVGQSLRVAPDESVAVVQPVTASGVEARPIEVAPAPMPTLIQDPKGGIQPYSEVALAKLRGEPLPPPSPAPTTVQPPAPPSPPGVTVAVATGPDGLQWMWPAGGRVLAGFEAGGNKGGDIDGKIGDAVVAAASGRVIHVGEGLRGFGKLVIIKHNDAFLSVYAHNHRILVKEGQQVARGQRIADLGRSDSDLPKLHFEIRQQSKPVDPLKILPAR